MVFRREDIEIMAPVGSFESLAAAIQARADAVYFGVGKLSMRAKSTLNFTLDNIKDIVSLCNENHIKTYLTLNTVMYDEDMAEIKTIVDAAKAFGVNALIVSDSS